MDRNILGKKFIVEVSGTRVTPEERILIKELCPVGFMFRKRNFLQNVKYEIWLQEYRELIQDLRNLLPNQNLILAIDHEGGLIIRPPLPITRFPYPAYWGDETKNVTRAVALELKSLAINLNFAPVVDVNSNPNNPVIKDRAFACSPEEVTQKAISYLRIMEEAKIACTAKHFPGHGNTKSDSHLELPTLDSTLAELETCELQPFQEMIKSGIPAIMPGHLYFPKIDAENFVTFSKIFLSDILRDKLGFQGIIISDAFSMEPAKKMLFRKDMLAKACSATLDIFSVVGPGLEMEDAIKVRDLLAEGIKQKIINQETCEKSIKRINNFTGMLANFSVETLAFDVLENHNKLAKQLSPNLPDSMQNIIVSK